MKKILLFILLIVQFEYSNGQCVGEWYLGYFTFEDTYVDYNCLFRRDTLAGHVNNWQIGRPGKVVLDSALSPNNVLITDTSNTYSPGDTSTCTVAKYPGTASLGWHWNGFGGYYYVNSDTLTDYGRLEFSPDNGITWVDILNDTTGVILWSTAKPILSGNSNGWKEFDCVIKFDVPGHLLTIGDTFLYRFTFISDTADTHKDGLMFDDIRIFDVAEGVADNSKNNTTINLFPNPAHHLLEVAATATIAQLTITNAAGRVYAAPQTATGSKSRSIDVSGLPAGLYLLQVTDAEGRRAMSRFVKE